MQLPSISSVHVSGLHDHYDISLDLDPGLNVIYGKNGKGKTTLLHILANVLEQDFARFSHLKFREIRIHTHGGSELRLERLVDAQGDDYVAIHLDGQYLGPASSKYTSPRDSKKLFSAALGPRAIYLPAFRAILDRFATQEKPNLFGIPPQKSDEHKKLETAETEYLKSLPSASRAYSYWYELSEVTDMTASKTLQCRAWFGEGVPVIRYPSLSEVEKSLGEEWRRAEGIMSQSESQMFSNMFVSVIETMADQDANLTPQPLPESMAALQESIPALEKAGYTSTEVLKKISAVVQGGRLAKFGDDYVPRKVLQLYADLMQKRVEFQKRAFDDLQQFEKSVNYFLDEKRLVLKPPKRRYSYDNVMFISPENSDLEFPLQSLSSGERQIVTMLFCASRFGRDRGIFLIDEPELSLHVDWQRAILGEIMRQAQSRQVIACTHSPEVGGEHDGAVKWFNPRRSLHGLHSLGDDEPF